MELALEVEAGGTTRRVDVDLALSPDDVLVAASLASAEALGRMHRGEYVEEAAQAIIYINLVRALSEGEPDWLNPPVDFDAFCENWESEPEPDLEMEAGLAELSEDL